MAKTKISEFSSTPANNTDIDSINIAEGCAPSGINDAIRELMAQLKDFQTGAVGDSFNGPIGTSTAAAGAFTTLSASGTATLSGLTASTALALDASKNIVSVTNTGTGSNVLATSPTLVTPALGTPSSGVVTNLTGTASININGTVGATTASTGAFTTLSASSTVTLSGGTANGVAYLNGSKVLTTGSALTFDGSKLAVGQSSVTAGSVVQVNGALLASGVVTALDTTNLGVQIGGGGTVAAGGASTVAGIYADVNGFGGASDLIIRPRSDASAGSLRVFTGTSGGLERYKIQADGTAIWTIGSEQMRLNSSGNLGIGTSSPGARLQVNAGTDTLKTLGTSFNQQIHDCSAGFSQAVWQYIGTTKALVGANSTNMLINTGGDASANIVFATGSGTTERARIDSSGNLLVGTTSTYGGPGRINVGFNQSNNFGITLRNTSATATGVFVSFENSGGTGNGSISQTNSTTIAYNTSSDRRLKTNISPALSASSDIDAIQVVSHGWVSNNDIVKYGVIAQDLELVAPQAVTKGDDGEEIEKVWGVDYSKLVPMLVKEIQSLRKRLADAGI